MSFFFWPASPQEPFTLSLFFHSLCSCLLAACTPRSIARDPSALRCVRVCVLRSELFAEPRVETRTRHGTRERERERERESRHLTFSLFPIDRHRKKPKQEAAALKLCHSEHPYAKFWGICNDQKLALDACFRNEKKLKR